MLPQFSFANPDYTSLRVFPGFSAFLNKPGQIRRMQFDCRFQAGSVLTGSIQVNPLNSQDLETTFDYQNSSTKFSLSTRAGNIKSVDVSLSEQVIERNGLGRGPNAWIMIRGDHWQSLSLEFFYWFGDFQISEAQDSITMTTRTAPFTYVDRPVYDQDPGVCTWIIKFK